MPIKRVIRPFSASNTDPKPKHKKDHSRLKRVLIWVALGLVGLIALSILAISIAFAWFSRDLPDPNTLITQDLAQSTKIYDRTGTVLLYEIHGDQNRTLVQLADLPKYVPEASIAIEDKTFYQNNGISIPGLIRAVIVNTLEGKKIQGTSTITQQLVKNAILTNERSLTRKLKEILLSLQIQQVYTKDQILQMYLNDIPYGSDIYGVESASETYFGKPAKDLTLDEAALLAALPQAPALYSPYGDGTYGDNRAALVARQQYILDQMAQQGYITKQQADDAKKVDVLKEIVPKNLGNIKAPHFVMYIRSLLESQYGLSDSDLDTKGYKVTTTLDWPKQQIAQAAVSSGVATLGPKYDFTNGALVSIDPKTGQILAMVGSANFFDDAHDGQVNVALSPRQPGSSFKPIVYSAAFAKGYTPETTLWDVDTVFKTDTGTDYEPKDYDLKERGPVSVRQALQGSLNIPAVKMLYLVGVSRVLDYAQTLGYTTLNDRSRFGLSLVLGGGEVKLLEHTNAYAAFANDGEQFPTSAILGIQDASGAYIQQWKQPDAKQVLDKDSDLRLTDVLSDNNARAYIFGANNYLTLPGRPVAAKTGTTNNYRDAWTLGYTPSLVTGVWVGNNDNSEMKLGADGSEVAAPIWQSFMKQALANTPVETFETPPPTDATKPVLLGKDTTVTVNIDVATGQPATADTPPVRIQQQVYHVAHDILYYVDKDDPRGPPPTDPNQDPQFANWEAGVQSWVQRTGWNSTTTLPVGLTLPDQTTVDQPAVTITDPQANATWNTRTGNISVSVSSTRPIVRMEASYQGMILGDTSAQPWVIPIHLPTSLDKGYHDITVTAYDDLGYQGSNTITLNVNAAPEPLTLKVLQPANNATLKISSFPQQVQIECSDLTQVSRVDLYMQTQDGSTVLIASANAPKRTQIPLVWSFTGDPGTYTIFPVMVDQNGNNTSGDRTTVTITK